MIIRWFFLQLIWTSYLEPRHLYQFYRSIRISAKQEKKCSNVCANGLAELLCVRNYFEKRLLLGLLLFLLLVHRRESFLAPPQLLHVKNQTYIYLCISWCLDIRASGRSTCSPVVIFVPQNHASKVAETSCSNCSVLSSQNVGKSAYSTPFFVVCSLRRSLF